jgi:DNA-directed RNA polymerase subunit K/omega
MDEFNNEPADDFEDMEEALDMPEEVETEQAAEARTSEAADLQKMFRQHPEIWIPYEEHVKERLYVRGPGDPNHTTYPLMTHYEFTKAISLRASMLDHGAMPYIMVPEGVTDTYQIAKMELLAKRLPFIFKRPLPNGQYEYWRLSDLLLPEEQA